MKKQLVFLFSLFIFQTSFVHAANIDPSFKFSTIETEHFSIHFHQGLEDLAQKAASIAEDAHDALIKEFQWKPREKTQMVLIDDSDFTNGWASVLPYNAIYLMIVPPSIDMTIGEYEDWLKVLITHEYSHILTMDPARGYSEITRTIFGKPIPAGDIFSFLVFLSTAPPNIFMPRWWHEGIATWAETEYTGVGRGRSAFYEMIIRMAVAENNIPTVGQINGEIPYWPDGHMPYIFGLRLQKYIADKYGKETIGKLNLSHAGRYPYALNGALLWYFGKTYSDIYQDMIRDLRATEADNIKTLQQTPFTQVKVLNFDGERLTNPRYSPDGKMIAFNRRDPHEHESIIIAGKEGAEIKELVRRLPSDHTISWSPDSETIYFSQAEVNRGFNIYQDLYSYNIKRKKLKRLTHGLRIKEPDISPDAKTFAVVVSERGNQNLALLTFDGDDYKLEKIIPPIKEGGGLRVSNPRWSPDGLSVAYSITDNEGKSRIYIYDIAENTHRLLVEGRGSRAYPIWSRDGRHIIYTSDETGVYNIFTYSIEEKNQHQITHLLGGAFQPDISIDGKEIIFPSYDSKGFKLSTLEYNQEEWLTTPGPVIKPYWNEFTISPSPLRGEGQGEGENPLIKGNEKLSAIEPKPYSALNTIWPRFWLPTLYSDHDGTVVGAFTAGQDVLGYNTYYLNVDYGAASKELYYDAVYLNDYAYPTFMLRTYARPVLYSDFLQKGDYYELNKSLIFSMSIPIYRIESRYKFIIGYHLQKQEAISDLTNNQFNSITVFQGRRDNIFAGIEFSNSLKYPYSISHEEGRNIKLLYKHYDNNLGSDLNSREYFATYSEYFLVPFSGLMRHSVVYLNIKGAIAEGDRTNQQAFQLGGLPFETEFPLRGYPSRFATGQYIATGTLEYRAPITYILQGTNTKPFFWDRLHAAIFTDAGEVWDDNRGASLKRLKVGAGIEARLDMTLGYYLEITPAFGIAHGFNQDGETVIYFTIYTNL